MFSAFVIIGSLSEVQTNLQYSYLHTAYIWGVGAVFAKSTKVVGPGSKDMCCAGVLVLLLLVAIHYTIV